VKRAEATDRGPGLTLRETFNLELVELADEEPGIVMLDADNATATTEGVFAAAHPDRFLQMGVAEQNMVGVAAGLAVMGFLPYVTSYACFQVFRAHDQVRVLLAQTGLPVRLVGQSAGLLTGLTGKTHQSIDDVAVMRAMPGMTVVVPGDEHETRAVLRWSIGFHGPVYIRLARGSAPLLFDASYRYESPSAIVVHDGDDPAILSTGLQTSRVLAALPQLEAAGLRPLVLHVPTLKPIDEEAIVEVARIAGRVVTVEDHNVIGGLGGAVAEVLSARYPVLLHRIGIADRYAESAGHDELVERYGISPAAVARSIVAWASTAGRGRRPGVG
jgi:transketolase